MTKRCIFLWLMLTRSPDTASPTKHTHTLPGRTHTQRHTQWPTPPSSQTKQQSCRLAPSHQPATVQDGLACTLISGQTPHLGKARNSCSASRQLRGKGQGAGKIFPSDVLNRAAVDHESGPFPTTLVYRGRSAPRGPGTPKNKQNSPNTPTQGKPHLSACCGNRQDVKSI